MLYSCHDKEFTVSFTLKLECELEVNSYGSLLVEQYLLKDVDFFK